MYLCLRVYMWFFFYFRLSFAYSSNFFKCKEKRKKKGKEKTTSFVFFSISLSFHFPCSFHFSKIMERKCSKSLKNNIDDSSWEDNENFQAAFYTFQVTIFYKSIESFDHVKWYIFNKHLENVTFSDSMQ